jgi:hypothetical protein
MSDLRTYKILVMVIAVALLASACGSAPAQESVIATAVAQTVQAGEVLTPTAGLPTVTQAPAAPALEATPTAAVTLTSEPPLVSAPADPNCAKASLIGENPPDETILTSGQYFWKTWTLQNTGTCTWTTAFNLVFWDGDRLGSSISYPLDDDVAPGESKDISIYLQAPVTGGTFTGYWRIKTPWGSNFGVGQYDASISTSVVVGSITPENKKTETVFGVTNVTYDIVRDCIQSNTYYRMTVYITSSGPLDVNFSWIQSDGNNRRVTRLNFTEAATKSASRLWIQGNTSSPNPRWVQVIITDPTYQVIQEQPLPPLCTSGSPK